MLDEVVIQQIKRNKASESYTLNLDSGAKVENKQVKLLVFRTQATFSRRFISR
jgi:hypothetical protein